MPFRVAAKRPAWETLRALAGGQNDFGLVGPTDSYLKAHPDYPSEVAMENAGDAEEPNEETARRMKRVTAALALGKMLKLPTRDQARMISRFSTKLDYFQPQYLEHGAKDPLKWPMIIIVGVLYVCLWLWMPGAATPLNLTVLTGMTVIALFLCSPGWSPQFIIYVLPFALIALSSRSNIAMALIISAITFAELPIWLLWRLKSDPDTAAPLLWVIVILRMTFFVLIASGLYMRAVSGRQSELSEKA